MTNICEGIGARDHLEVLHKRNGVVINKRVTAPKKSLWVKILKKLSLGHLYADDLVTNAGLAKIALDMTTSFLGVAVGTDQGVIVPLAVTNTTLGAETNRVASTNTRTTTTVTNDTAKFEATVTFSSPTNVKESGVFTSSTSGGTMLCRQTFDVLSMKAGDELTLVWKVVAS